MSATVTPLPTPIPARDPALEAELAELRHLGLAVARLASRLAEVEIDALDAAAETARGAARTERRDFISLAHARQSGLNIDRSEAERDALAARAASLTATYDRAARAIRRTAFLQARLTAGRPFRAVPELHGPSRALAHAVASAPGYPANDADGDGDGHGANDPPSDDNAPGDAEWSERLDTPDWDDAAVHQTAEEFALSIRCDVEDAAAWAAALSPNIAASDIPASAAPRFAARHPRPDAAPAPARTRPNPLPPPDT